MCGKVYIVGAGPGDPDLITVKGLELVKAADVILYDRLVNKEILRYARNAKEIIYVGKRPGESYRQEEVNKLMIKYAKRYNIVVRLKGGDPILFGRGGEEMEALREAGIEYEVVPGVSSALAGPTYAGIPVTHRRYSSSVAILTGIRSQGEKSEIFEVAKAVDTLVILMGVGRFKEIIDELKRVKSLDTPIAVIMNATLDTQKVVTTSLGDADKYIDVIKPPAIIVVGEVVKLRDMLKWFR